MKSNLKNLFFSTSAIITLTLSAPTASAINLYWDTNTTGTVGSGAATGNWGLGVNWSTDSTGLNVGPVTLTAITTGLDDLFFSAGTNGTGGTVTVDTSRTAKSITFEEGAITLSGGTMITLAGGGGLTVAAGGLSNATISTALTINGNNTFNVGAGSILNLTGAFTRGTRATLNVLSTGAVTSTKTGLDVNDATGIIGTWASFNSGANTTYARFSGSTIGGLAYAGGLDGTGVASAASITDVGGAVNYSLSGTTATATGAGAVINTLRYTGAGVTISATNALTTKGIMNVGGGTLIFSNAVTAGASGTELVVNTANGGITFNGIFTGTITKTGTGTMTLGAVAHSVGAITVNQGILVTNNAGGDAFGNVTVNSGGTLRTAGGNSRFSNNAVFTVNAGGTWDLFGSTDQIGGIVGAGSVTNTGANANMHFNTTGSNTFSGVIASGSGTVGVIINGVGGTQAFTGLNTFTGVTDIRNGTLSANTIKNVATPSSLGAPALGNATILFGSTASTGTLVYTGTGDDTDRIVRLNGTTGGATITQSGASGLLRFTSNLSVPGAAATDQRKTLTLQGSTAGTGEISGIISDAVLGTAGQLTTSVSKSGTGTWTLSGANTYTGTTTVSGGILKLNNATALPGGIANTGGTSALNIAGGIVGLTANFSRGYGTTASTFQITAGGGFAAYGGDRTVTPGTLAIGSTLGSDIVGTLTLGAANADSTLIWASNLSFGGSQRTVLVNNGSATVDGRFSGVLSGGTSSGIDKTGTGTLEFTNTSNSYSGATTITAGTLRLGAAGVIPNTSNVSVTGTLDLNGFNETINNLTGAGTVDNSAASTNATLTVGGGGFFNGTLTDSGTSATLALVKSGSGADLILAGNNSYSGGTTLNSGGAGRLFIEGANALPTTGAVQVNSGGTLNFNTAASPTFNQSITLASGATLSMRQAATLGNVTLPTSGSVIFNSDNAATVAFSLGNNVGLTGDLTVQVGGNNATVGAVTLGGNISGGFGLNKTQIGTLILSGANGYTGDTTISAGTLRLGASGVIANGSSVVTTGTLDLNGFNETINGLSGAGIVDNTAASNSTLTVNGGGTFSGNITDSGAGTLALVKSVDGDLVLSGNNTYTGGTTLNANRIFIAGANALPTTGAVQVNGGTLNFNVGGNLTFNQSITLASGATLAMRQAATLGNVTLPTSGSVIFNNDDAATVAFTLGNNVGLTGNLTVQVGGNHATVGAVTLGGDISGTGFGLNKTSTGKLVLSGTNTYDGATLVNAGSLLVNGSLAAASAVSVGANGTLGGNGTVNGTLDISGNLAPGAAGVDIQTLAAGTTTWNGGSNLWNFDLAAGAGSSDLLAITGDFTKGTGSTYKFDFMSSAPATWGNAYTLATWTGTTSFLATDFSFQGLTGSYTDGTFTFSGNSLVFTAVPEPTSALVGLLIGAGLLRRRRTGQGRVSDASGA